MNGVDLLSMQLLGSCSLSADKAAEAEPHWTERAYPGVSLPGFVAWHCARIIDWGVNTVIRDTAEVASEPEWSERVRYDMGHGAGLTDAEADATAASVSSADVGAYARALRENISAWMSCTDAVSLDAVPDLRSRNRDHPRYATPRAWEEIKHLEGLPAWQFLARPCVLHIRVHAGEVETLLKLLDAQPIRS